MYSGTVCPFCQQDKMNKLMNGKYQSKKSDYEISSSDLKKLKEHFNKLKY
jgi:succinylglutamate desuccinylase